MKTTLVIVLLSVSAIAQKSSILAPAQAACGPVGVNFDTDTSFDKPPAQPDPGKALVYVAEDFPTLQPSIGAPTIKVGLDGAWTGATHGESYLFFQVVPGEHHLCVKRQSHLGGLSKLTSFARLNAEPGKTYYFRARATGPGTAPPVYLDLDAIDPDEGQYLVATSPLIASHPKK